MVFLHLAGMDYAKVPPDVKMSQVRALQLLVLFFG